MWFPAKPIGIWGKCVWNQASARGVLGSVLAFLSVNVNKGNSMLLQGLLLPKAHSPRTLQWPAGLRHFRGASWLCSSAKSKWRQGWEDTAASSQTSPLCFLLSERSKTYPACRTRGFKSMRTLGAYWVQTEDFNLPRSVARCWTYMFKWPYMCKCENARNLWKNWDVCRNHDQLLLYKDKIS